jgi:hypothetical protein
MIAMWAATGKYQNKEIAAKVGCHINTITRVLKMPEAQQLIETMQVEIQLNAMKTLAERFDEAAQSAFEKLQSLMAGAASENLQFKASESIFDRASTSPKRMLHQSPTQTNVMQINITIDELKRMRDSAVAMGEDMPPLPDVAGTVIIDAQTGEIMADER